MADISKITIPNPQAGQQGQPNNLTFDIKDAVARAAIIAGFSFKICTNAANTPYGVTWMSGSTLITGELVASAETKGFYLVPSVNTETKDSYKEYVTVLVTENPAVYAWEKIGDTEIDFSNLAKYLDADVTKTTDKVLGESTTFTNSSSAVSFGSDGTSVTFVKSYPGQTSKLETGSVRGVKSTDVSFYSIDATGATTYQPTKTVFGTSDSAVKVNTSGSVDVAKAASSATSVSYIGNQDTNSVLKDATVSGETLILGSVSVTQGSVTGAVSNGSVNNYTFTTVTVPQVTSNDTVSIKTKATSAAQKDDNATTIATGSLKSNDTIGATIMTGLGTATTDTAIKTLPSATAAAQTITVGSNDKVDALTDVDVTIINKTNP